MSIRPIIEKYKNKLRITLVLSVALFYLLGCKSINEKEDNYGFKFLVISDIHVSTNLSHEVRLKEFVNKFNTHDSINEGVYFIATTGDNISYVYSSRDSDRDLITNNHLRKYMNIMSNLSVPVYSSMGNHEYKIDKNRDSDGFFPENEILELEKLWKKETGLEPYYAIGKGDFKLVFLNSMRGRFVNRFFDDNQMLWLNDQLLNSDNVVLFFHHPIRTDNIEYWYKKKEGTITEEIEPMFFDLLLKNKKKIKAMFVGHGHRWMTDKLFETIPVYETSSFGDNEDFMYYTVKVNYQNVKVVKSVNQPFFSGFQFKDYKND